MTKQEETSKRPAPQEPFEGMVTPEYTPRPESGPRPTPEGPGVITWGGPLAFPCPQCKKESNHLRNVGRTHWGVCLDCKVTFVVGDNLLSNWRGENESIWEANATYLSQFEVVEYAAPESPLPTHPSDAKRKIERLAREQAPISCLISDLLPLAESLTGEDETSQVIKFIARRLAIEWELKQKNLVNLLEVKTIEPRPETIEAVEQEIVNLSKLINELPDEGEEGLYWEVRGTFESLVSEWRTHLAELAGGTVQIVSPDDKIPF